MNLLAARIALRPRALGDVLDLAVPFCLGARRPFGMLALGVLGPIAVAAAALRVWGGWGWGAVWLLVAPLSLLAQGIFTIACGEVLFTPPSEVRARGVLAQLQRRLGPYLGTFLTRLVAVVAISVPLVSLPLVPGFLFVSESLLLERVGVSAAFSRSRALARNRGFFCMGLWLCTLLLPFSAAMAAELAGTAVVQTILQLGAPFGSLWTDGGSGFAVAGVLLAAPVAAAARFLGYVDLRTRKEGWDIQLRFAALAADDAAAARRAA